MTPSAIVVLAGGRASRLPGKLLLEARGTPLVVRVVDALLPADAAGASRRGLVIATNATDEPPLRALLARERPDLRPRFVRDARPFSGPRAALAGVARSLDDEWLFLVGGDMPSIDLATLEALERARDEAPGCDAVVATPGGRRQPLGALYRRAAVARDDAEPGRRASLHDLLRGIVVHEVAVTDDRAEAPRPAAFVNINAPADLDAFDRRDG